MEDAEAGLGVKRAAWGAWSGLHLLVGLAGLVAPTVVLLGLGAPVVEVVILNVAVLAMFAVLIARQRRRP